MQRQDEANADRIKLIQQEPVILGDEMKRVKPQEPVQKEEEKKRVATQSDLIPQFELLNNAKMVLDKADYNGSDDIVDIGKDSIYMNSHPILQGESNEEKGGFWEEGMRKPMGSIVMVSKEEYMSYLQELNGEILFDTTNVHVRDNYF